MVQHMNSIDKVSSLALALLSVSAVSVLALMSGCKDPHPTQNYPEVEKAHVLVKPTPEDDFAFPSTPPKLSVGKAVFESKCPNYPKTLTTYEVIHHVKPIEMYLDMAHGKYSCSKQMTRDERWAAVLYVRYLAGEYTITRPGVDAIFGANCAVCHGGKGKGNGPLYTGHASDHKLGMAPVKNNLQPPPANFWDYSRVYNRSNAHLVKFINEGIYPSAMPSWKGRVDHEKGFVFDDALILDLVRYVRSLSMVNDLPAGSAPAPAAPSANGNDDGADKKMTQLPQSLQGAPLSHSQNNGMITNGSHTIRDRSL